MARISWGNCKVCGRYQSPRAVYIRLPGKGFVRIGWYYKNCGHVVLD